MGFHDMDLESGDDKYLKIDPGATVQFHILSKDPIKTVNHWINKKKSECEGKTCDYCAQGDRPKKGWKVKVFDRGSLTVKEYEFGPQVAAQIKNIAEILAENHQTVDDIDFRIKREGSGLMDTEYFVNQVASRGPIADDIRESSQVPF